MQVSPVDALRELEPILREIETERSQQVHRFAQITLWSVIIGGLLSLALAMFQIGLWSLAPMVIALMLCSHCPNPPSHDCSVSGSTSVMP